MRKVFVVIRREYLDRVRKKSFWLGTFVFPAVFIGLMVGVGSLFMLKPETQRQIAVVDATGAIFGPFQARLSEQKFKDGRPEFVLEAIPLQGSLDETRRSIEPRIGEGKLYGIITIGDELEAKENFRFYGQNVGNLQVLISLERALKDAVVGVRFERSQLKVDRATIEKLTASIDLETFQTSKTGEAKKKGFSQALYGTFIFVVILYMALILYGVAVMRGILEEKSNRIMEVLLGSLSPSQLMTGKIVGIGLVGLTQMAVYALTGAVVRLYIGAQQVQAEWTSMLDSITVVKMIYFVIFFALGYFLYVSLFAAVGAVCNTEQEAQNLQAPVTMILIIPYLATFFVVGNPDSTLSVVASLIPFFTPMVMFSRISTLMPPFWQIALSIVLMLATIWLLFRGVAKIFRIGVLMYGKRPTIPEILRWARS